MAVRSPFTAMGVPNTARKMCSAVLRTIEMNRERCACAATSTVQPAQTPAQNGNREMGILVLGIPSCGRSVIKRCHNGMSSVEFFFPFLCFGLQIGICMCELGPRMEQSSVKQKCMAFHMMGLSLAAGVLMGCSPCKCCVVVVAN